MDHGTTLAARHGVNECYVLHHEGKGREALKRNALYPWWALDRITRELIPSWDGQWREVFDDGGPIENWLFDREAIAGWLRGRPFIPVFDFRAPGGAVIDPESAAWAAIGRILTDEPIDLEGGDWGEFEQQSQAARHIASHGRWPWGDHETKLLRDLAAAAQQWWSTFDPKQPGTAPTNDDVVQYLVARGVSPSVAAAMATVLRADGLQTGRRKRVDPSS